MLARLDARARHRHFFVAQAQQARARCVAQSRVQLHFRRVGFGDAGFGQARHFVGEREFRVVVGVGGTRVAPGVNRVVFSLRPFAINIPPEHVGFDEIAQRMIGPRGFEFVRERDGFLRLAQIHQIDGFFCIRGNIEFGGARLARRKAMRTPQSPGRTTRGKFAVSALKPYPIFCHSERSEESLRRLSTKTKRDSSG